VVLSLERVRQPGYVSFQLTMTRSDAAALAVAVRARGALGPLSFAERGDLLAWTEAPTLTIHGDAEALEELAAAVDEIAQHGRHRHVPLYGDDGRERGELIVAAS
jgi:hypothetical protein